MLLSFDTGVKSYTVNGVENAFSANLTDGNFIDRLCEAVTTLERQHKAFSVPDDANLDDTLDAIRGYDKNVRKAIDGVLGDGVSDKVFGDLSTFALAGGQPIWLNLLFSIMEESERQFAEEERAVNPKLKKFIRKYGKK